MVVQCLERMGYLALLQEDGGISLPGRRTDEQQKQLLDDQRSCARSIDPRRLLPPPALTDGQWLHFYAYLIAQVDCLRGLGHDVPQPPDFETWRATDRAWDPYLVLTQGGRSAPTYHVLTCQNVPERPDFLDW